MIKYNSIIDIKKIYIPMGFRYYKNPFASESVVASFWKKYEDSKGIKYYIKMNVFDCSNANSSAKEYQIEFCGQYYQKGTHNAMDITFIDWEFEQVENWLNEMFEKGLIEYEELIKR